MQVVKAELAAEKRQVARIKACSGDLMKLEDELKFCKEHNGLMADKVQETHNEMET